jgi:membrane peptidoglycan carboxypeptidase
MGQEIGVTPLQILNMVSAVANGGILYRPYVVQKIEGPGHDVLSMTESQGERIISENTARELQDMLEVVVTDGTAKGGRLDGYRAAGKTGTAQKIDETGRYSPTKFVASFAGFAPVSNPVLSLIVVVDEPVGLHQGGSVAAPIFKNIAEQVLRYRGVEPDIPQYAPRYLAVPPPVTAPKLKIETLPQWKLTEAAYTAAAGPVSVESGEIVVPDFTGASLRQVAVECSRLGLTLHSDGSGQASWQSLQVGSHVRAGARIHVQFSPRRP